MKLILESMDKYFYQFGGIHSVIIDGIGDLLPGVNEEEGSVALIEGGFALPPSTIPCSSVCCTWRQE